MSALLGIDVGERRLGVALAEDGGLSARPLVTLPRGRQVAADAAALRALADRHGVGGIVVGLPLEAAGGEGRQADLTRAWASGISAILGEELPISFRDERLSSHLAETRLGPMKRGRSGGPPTRDQRAGYRARVDREAAAIILQDELDARREARASAAPLPATQEDSR
ncbi:MAG: Holliday junction resolvase RuvX [Candidatus Limnocylindrales bacterium]